MTIEYEWTRKDLKKELTKKRNNVNLIYLLGGVILYILFMYDAIASELFDKLVILIGGFIFAFAFSIILWLSTKIYVSISLRKNDKKTDKAYGTYVIEATDKMISVTINEQTIAYNYKDITKFKKKRHTFFIRTADDKIGLLFKEHIIGREKYRQLLDIVSKNVSC